MKHACILFGGLLLSLGSIGLQADGLDGLRNPFWPIGYVPVAQVQEAAPKEPTDNKRIDLGLPEGVFSPEEIALFQKVLAPSGIFTQGSKRFAVIQGDLVGEGDLTRVEHKGRKLKFRVKHISAEAIVLRYEDPNNTPQPRSPSLRPGPLPLTEAP